MKVIRGMSGKSIVLNDILKQIDGNILVVDSTESGPRKWAFVDRQNIYFAFTRYPEGVFAIMPTLINNVEDYNTLILELNSEPFYIDSIAELEKVLKINIILTVQDNSYKDGIENVVVYDVGI
jgi:hypothetical protein